MIIINITIIGSILSYKKISILLIRDSKVGSMFILMEHARKKIDSINFSHNNDKYLAFHLRVIIRFPVVICSIIFFSDRRCYV
jgi:hypothetical protein